MKTVIGARKTTTARTPTAGEIPAKIPTAR
jgi:hypothetical protein